MKCSTEAEQKITSKETENVYFFFLFEKSAFEIVIDGIVIATKCRDHWFAVRVIKQLRVTHSDIIVGDTFASRSLFFFTSLVSNFADIILIETCSATTYLTQYFPTLSTFLCVRCKVPGDFTSEVLYGSGLRQRDDTENIPAEKSPPNLF